MRSVEFRVDIGGVDWIPHAFIVVTGSDGVEHGYGLAPKEHGTLTGDGEIYDDTNHEYSGTTGKLDLTESEYSRLMDFINESRENPPPYYLPFGSQCANWAAKALAEAGIPAFASPNLSPDNLLQDIFETVVWNPYTQWLNIQATQIIEDLRILFNKAQQTISPLVLDLDGLNGAETISQTAGIHFDHDASQFAEQTGWVGKNDGLLVWDRNANGQIDNGGELFGNHTVLASGENAAHGFVALAELDANQDGVVNIPDAAFANLRVFKDANSNGVVDAGELLTLAQAGVKSLNTAYTDQTETDAQGNQHLQAGSYTTTSNETRAMTDVWFAVDTALTVDTQTVEVGTEIEALPDLKGFGNVRSLHQAMARDASGTLQTLVQQHASTSDVAERASLIDNLIYHWVGVQDVDPESRAATEIYGNVIGDARKLAALEAFLGQGYLGTWCWGTRDPNPHGQASPILLTAYGQLADWVDSQVLAQSLYKPLYDSIGLAWNADGQSLELDVAAVVDLLRTKYELDVASAKELMVNFVHNLNAQGDLGKQVASKLKLQGSLQGEGFDFFLATVGYTPTIGTEGAETLAALDGVNNMFIAGAGDDTILAGAMKNVFVFDAGDGWDTIHEYHSSWKVGGANKDTLQLGLGIDASATQVIRGMGNAINDLTLAFGGGDQVTLKNYFDSGYRLQSITFADGTEWDYTKVASLLKYAGSDGDDSATGLIDQENDMDGRAGNDAIMGGNFNDDLRGGVGNDTLNGGNGGDDTLTGGTGNDVLDGGIGSDTYVFDSGDGADRITDYDYFDGNLDTLRLGAGLLAANIEVFRVSDDLLLRWAGNTSDSVTIKRAFSYGQVNTYQMIERVTFSDQTVWGIGDLMNRVVQAGSPGNDTLMGLDIYTNRLGGGDGNDTLVGGYEADVLEGGAGDDTLYGYEGADILSGGQGADTLYGGAGNDTYIFNLGDGADKIDDHDYLEGNQDTLHLGAGLFVAGTQVTRSGDDLLLRWAGNTSDSVTIKNAFSYGEVHAPQMIERLIFSDQTVWGIGDLMNRVVQSDLRVGITLDGGALDDALEGGAGDDALNGNAGADSLTGGQGNDTLDGGAGNDTYIFSSGDGADKIVENDGSSANVDTLLLGEGLSAAETQVIRRGYDVLLRWAGNHNDSVTIQGVVQPQAQARAVIESVTFSDNTVWSFEELMTRLVQDGSAGDDHLSAFHVFSNRMRGFDGDDTLDGGALADVLEGGAGDDTLNGNEGADFLTGGQGNDTLHGGAGNDTYIFNPGDGEDKIVENDATSGDVNTLRLGAGLSSAGTKVARSGDDLLLRWAGNHNDSVTILGALHSQVQTSGVIESVTFSDHTVWSFEELMTRLVQDGGVVGDTLRGFSNHVNRLRGLGGDDTLIGGALEDVLEGGAGDDLLEGGLGNDTYVFGMGDGRDSIADADITSGSNDVLRLGAGLMAANTQVVRSGDDMVLRWTGNHTDAVTIRSAFAGSQLQTTCLIESVEFADSPAWNLSELMQRLVHESSASNGYLTGLSGYSNRMKGLAGDDTLVGEAMADELDGGVGSDALIGGLGNDVYLFDAGYGHDVVIDADDTSGNVDTVRLGHGLTAAITEVMRSGNDLVLRWTGMPTDSLTLRDFFSGNLVNLAQVVEEVHFADGVTKWDFTRLMSELKTTGTSGDDTLTGLSEYANRMAGMAGKDMLTGGDEVDWIDGGVGDDTLFGGLGNDTLTGGAGNDTYLFGRGDGADTILAETGTEPAPLNTLQFKDGVIPTDVVLSRVGDALVFTIAASSDTVTANAFFDANPLLSPIQHVRFADGSEWDLAEMAAILAGGSGPDRAPTVAAALQSQNINEDSLWSYTIPNGTFTDADAGDVLTYSATLADGSPLPAWLSFNPTTRTFSGTPGNAQVGTLQLQVTATDTAGVSASTPFTLQVANVNDAPELTQTLTDQAFHHSTSLSYTLPAGAFTDPDGDALIYSMAMADGSPLPHWISLVGRELTVGNSSIREPFYDVVITATDPSGVQVSSSMTLHLTRDGALPTVSSTSITLAADQHHAVLSGTDALNATGNSLNNKLVGNSAANELRGLDGDDELNGRGGADTLWGGQGNDVYYVDHVGDLVIELAGEGHADLVISTIGYTLPDHVEQLSLLTHAHVNLTGNALNNKLTGQNGDNVLDGKEGADTLRGYGGNDTYVIDNAGDTITELANEGTLDVAQLWTSFSFLALSANRGAAIERIEVMGNDALNATGNAKGQQIAGNEAANELRGGGGADTILGQGGDDRLILGTAERASLGTSSYDGGEGQDTLALASDQSGVLLDFSAYGSTTFTGIERVNLTGGGHNTARLTIDQLLHMPDAGVDKLIVLGNAGDAVQLAGGSGNWSSEGTQSWQGLDYSVYSHSGAVGRELFVQQGITVM